jgi:protein ImuA
MLSATPGNGDARLSFGVAALDTRLGGGLAVAALHELYATREGDRAAAAAFALLLTLRCGRTGPLVWLREDKARHDGRLYGMGLAELGGDPARLLLVQAPDTLALLRAGAESVACAAVAAVILEPWGKAGAVDLTATRRLALAAARSGVLTLLLRSGDAGPSAAHSRWQVSAAPSAALAANAPGAPAFEISLLRHRGGVAAFETLLEWSRESRSFAAPLSGGPPAAAVQRADAARGTAAERRAA